MDMDLAALIASVISLLTCLGTLVYTRKIFQAQRWNDLREAYEKIKLFVNEVATKGSTHVNEVTYKNLFNLYLSRISFFKNNDKVTLLIERIMSRYQKLLMANSFILNPTLTEPEKKDYQDHINEYRKYFQRLAQEDLLKSDKDLEEVRNDTETITDCFKKHIDYGNFFWPK